MSGYLIEGKRIDKADPALGDYLKAAHGKKQRPMCLCIPMGIAMYIAKVGDTHIIKRMPNSGKDHDPDCDSFETPQGLSGLGEVIGQAIKENDDDGTTTLKLDFSLSKGAHRAPPTASNEEKSSVRTDGKKLTLRGTLHYLWEQAGFNRWSPAMAGKRRWPVIRKYLQESAQRMIAKGENLENLIYLPEPFELDNKDEIIARREKILRRHTSVSDQRKLLILIGEVKQFEKTNFGGKLIVKHVPDRHFFMNSDIWGRAEKRFARQNEMAERIPGSSRIVIATFSVNRDNYANIEELAMMNITENWIPFESGDEKQLLDKLVNDKRRFIKQLRYNLAETRAVASAVLTDMQSKKLVALHVVPVLEAKTDERLAELQAEYEEDLERVIEESHIEAWKWDAPREGMPALPA